MINSSILRNAFPKFRVIEFKVIGFVLVKVFRFKMSNGVADY